MREPTEPTELTDAQIRDYYDRHQAHLVSGLPEEGQVYLRSKYIRDIRANPTAMAELRETLAVEWRRQQAERRIRHGRIADAVFLHLDACSLPQPDWPQRIREAAEQFARIIEWDNHPDDVDRAQAGMSALAGIWLTEDEVEALYLGAG